MAFKKKETMDRVARNHYVSRPTANHNIIARLDHAILLLPRCPRFFSHMGNANTAVVEREELAARMGGQSFFSESPCILFPDQPATCRLLHVVLLKD